LFWSDLLNLVAKPLKFNNTSAKNAPLAGAILTFFAPAGIFLTAFATFCAAFVVLLTAALTAFLGAAFTFLTIACLVSLLLLLIHTFLV
jgi:hypothetical protein